MVFLGLKLGSLADWVAVVVNNSADFLTAIGTIVAICMTIKVRTDKAKLKINVEFIYSEYYLDVIDHWEVNGLGEREPIFSENDVGPLADAGYNLTIYISNIRQSSGLITSWGVYFDGKKRVLSEDPIMIKGFEVIKISRGESIETEGNPDYIIEEIIHNKNSSGKFKLFFEEVNGKIIYCNVKEKQSINK